MFVSTAKDLPAVVCEDCYRSTYYGNASFTKVYKHCVLRTITPEMSGQICRCPGVAHLDRSGNPSALSSISGGKREGHTNECSLLELDNIVALAKYRGLVQSVVGTENPSKAASLSSKFAAMEERNRSREQEQRPAAEPTADTDIPLFFSKFTTKRPFGNVHMALRVGPLLIENGVAQ